MKKKIINPPFSAFFKGGKFYNYHPQVLQESSEWLWPSVKMFIDGQRRRQLHVPDVDAWVEPFHGYTRSSEPIITWLGHATVLIQIGDINIITDPIAASPSWLYERVLPFGVSLNELPPIDIVLISHNHRDHMDAPTLKFLLKRDNPLFLVPQGDKVWFKKQGAEKVEEHLWWETSDHQGVDCTFVPAWHWSQRGIFDHNTSLWGGWVIQAEGYTIYFAGDTAYEQKYFRAIGEVFPDIDVVLMPIGPGDPDKYMRKSHVNAEQAGEAFIDCGARFFIPIHWGTFYFGIDLFHHPVERIFEWWKLNQARLPENSLFLNKVGQEFHLGHHKKNGSNRHGRNR